GRSGYASRTGESSAASGAGAAGRAAPPAANAVSVAVASGASATRDDHAVREAAASLAYVRGAAAGGAASAAAVEPVCAAHVDNERVARRDRDGCHGQTPVPAGTAGVAACT